MMMRYTLVVTLLLIGYTTASKNGCPKSTKTAYFVIDNTELITSETIEYKDFSEEECQSTCSSNLDTTGSPIECSSFAYDHVSFTCTVYGAKAHPEGKAEVKQAVGKRYFEKFCLSEGVPSTCAEAQFIRADDSVLIGFAANVTLVDSLEDCVSNCVKEPACKSSMFFYEEGECITNTESALSRPSSFAREDTEKVIYFQNGCMARSSFVESSSPKPFAAVDFESNKKTSDEFKSSELPLSAEEEVLDEEEDVTTTTAAPKKRRSKSTTASTTTTTTTTTTEAPIDLNEEYDSEELEEKSTTKAPKKTKKEKSKKNEAEDLKKFDKHPKNFGSKTHLYKARKGEKKDVPKVDTSLEEEVSPAVDPSLESVDDEVTSPADPYTTFFSEWSDWTPCKTSGERRIRRRKCLDLRRCLGALMQVENCPAITTKSPELIKEEEIKSVRSIVPIPLDGDEIEENTSSAPTVEVEIAEPGADVGDGYIWSPWLGTCQKFASGQPCNNGEMIGFESRECVAKDPSQCQGPFFRYCTLPC